MINIEVDNHGSSPIARGQRLKVVRLMAGLTRNEIEEDKEYPISASTIQSWEAAKAGGLTERGVVRILPLLHNKGVYCTREWLLHGIGEPPQPANVEKNQPYEEPKAMIFEDKAVLKELLAFRNANSNVLDLMLQDDGMAPHYIVGDYVAGRGRGREHLEKIVGRDCIVRTTNNELLFRRIKSSSRPGFYTLACINPDTTVPNPTLYDQQILNAAPVIWHRREDLYVG